MENEQEEVIIDSTPTDELEVEEPIVGPQEETQEEVTPETEKPKETPEAKFARLTRQAEQLAKKHGFKTKVEEPQERQDLTTKDIIVLSKANIHEEDIDEVLEYAKFKKISVADALKSSVIKASIAEKAEFRRTSEATNSGKTRSGAQKVSGEALIAKAQKTGELPDSDEGIEALVAARHGK